MILFLLILLTQKKLWSTYIIFHRYLELARCWDARGPVISADSGPVFDAGLFCSGSANEHEIIGNLDYDTSPVHLLAKMTPYFKGIL